MSANIFRKNAARIVCLAALAAPEARAECSYILGNLERKMEAHRVHRERNLRMLHVLIGTENNCRDTGASVSSKIATMAAARSCDAQVDASGMNRELTEIGAKCEAHFKEQHALEVELRESFVSVKAQLLEGLEFQRNDEVLTEFCASEIKKGFAVLDEFVKLETDILATEARALDGETNYGKFKQTSEALRAATASRGRDCGEMASAVLATISKAAAPGPGALPVPSGKSPRPASDITGTLEAKKAASLGRAEMLKKPVLKSYAKSADQMPATVSGRSPASFRSADESFLKGQISSLGKNFDPSGTYSRYGALSMEPAWPGREETGSEALSKGAVLFSPEGDDQNIGLNITAAEKSSAFTGEIAHAGVRALGEIWVEAQGAPELASLADGRSIFEQVKLRYRQTELFRKR